MSSQDVSFTINSSVQTKFKCVPCRNDLHLTQRTKLVADRNIRVSGEEQDPLEHLWSEHTPLEKVRAEVRVGQSLSGEKHHRNAAERI